MPNGITRDTFKGYTTDSKLLTLFDILVDVHVKQTQQIKICDPRFKKLENRKWIDKGLATASGFGGGFFAVVILSLKKLFL
jgi:hypothetical protein